MLANENLDADLDLVAPKGRIVIIGNRGRIEIDPRKVMVKDATIGGVFLWGVSAEDLALIYQDLVLGLEQGVLVPVVGQEFQLTAAAAAHEAIMNQRAYGKVVIIP